MNFDNIVLLVGKAENGKNSYGEIVFKEQITKLFCQKKSVKQSEFFQAAANGFKPEIVLEVNSFEYQNQGTCYFEGQKFKIYRAYPIKNTERTELYLTAIVGETNVTPESS